MDGFSANVLLSAFYNNPDRSVINELYKELQQDKEEISSEVRVFIETAMGKKCKIIGTSYEGEVTGVNDSIGGFYPGHRFPYLVKIMKSDEERFQGVVGEVFEYGFDQIQITE